MFDRVIMTVRMLKKTKTLKKRNTRCFLVLNNCLPRSTACKKKTETIVPTAFSYYSMRKRKEMRSSFTFTVRKVARMTTHESA